MNKHVIYTVIVGNIDSIHQPIDINEQFDYVLFTDKFVGWGDKIGVWQIRNIPSVIEGDNRLLSRYPKCLPTALLSEYDDSLYIDGTIQIVSPTLYQKYLELVENNTEWAGIYHCYRDCAYQEMQAILDMHWVHDYETIGWYKKIKDDGFPKHYGLLENNIIFRRHTHNIEVIGREWWDSLRYYCKRDQFSLMYIMWKYDFKADRLLAQGEDAWHTNLFKYHTHLPHNRYLRWGILEKIRGRAYTVSPLLKIGLLEYFSKFKYPILAMNIWSIYAIIPYGPKVLKRILKRELNKNNSL